MPLTRANAFCQRFGLRIPILQAPMAGACPPALAIAIANAGGLGGCGALLMSPADIAQWAATTRAGTNGGFQINLWIPDPPPARDQATEARMRDFLSQWGPPVPPSAADTPLNDFAAQCEAILTAGPASVSSIMGLYPPDFVARLKQRNIAWFATATTVKEAKAAQAAGADAIVAQGAEAGGHRGSFNPEDAERQQVGLFALLPAITDAVTIPVVATGGIADPRTIAAALLLGASAVQIGTGFLRCPEANTHPIWADALAATAPEDTVVTKAFSGRPGRSIATNYTKAVAAETITPYPIQRALTAGMRAAGGKANDIHRMQVWAGQSAALAKAEPAAQLVQSLWAETVALLKHTG